MNFRRTALIRIAPIALLATLAVPGTAAPRKIDGTAASGRTPAAERASHRVRWLHHGVEALELRLQMIARAEQSIDLESYIFWVDKSGRAILQAITRRKKERPDLKVRILVDAQNAGKLKSEDQMPGVHYWYRQALMKLGVDIRVYNDTYKLNIGTYNRRNHRKLLAIDGREMIVGGRNIGDEYFDVVPQAETEQWLDRDQWIEGPLVKEAVYGFQQFFTATSPEELRRGGLPSQMLGLQRALEEVSDPSDADLAFREHVRRIGGAQLERGKVYDGIQRIALSYELPNDRYSSYASPAMALDQSFKWANQEIRIENFLILPVEERLKQYAEALARKTKIKVLTNSEVTILHAIPEKLSQWRQDALVTKGLESWQIDNRIPEGTELIGTPNLSRNPISIHSKTFLFKATRFDRSINRNVTSWRIGNGSFNEDGRSMLYNFETMVFIGVDAPEDGSVPEIVRDLEAEMDRRQAIALPRHTGESLNLDRYKDDPWYMRLPKRLSRWLLSLGAQAGDGLF